MDSNFTLNLNQVSINYVAFVLNLYNFFNFALKLEYFDVYLTKI